MEVFNVVKTYKSTVKKLPDGMQVEAESRSFTIKMDEPKSMGGTDTAMNPIEASLAALGGCQAIVAASFAKAKNISFDDFHIEVEGDVDLDGFAGRSDVRPGFLEIRYKMYFKTNESQDKMDDFATFIEETCPVSDTLKNGTTFVNVGVVLE